MKLQANLYICGTQKIEGAPYLKEEHLDVFDCKQVEKMENVLFIIWAM